MIEINGYDKDADVYISYCTIQNGSPVPVRPILHRLAEMLSKDELRNPDTDEPIDWIEVINDQSHYYITSPHDIDVFSQHPDCPF